MKIVFAPLVIFICFFFSFNGTLYAQGAQLLELDNKKAYGLIDRLISTGYLESLNPIKQPYSHFEVYQELEKIKFEELSRLDQEWYKQLRNEIRYSKEREAADYTSDPYIIGGSVFNNTERKNVYRPSSNEYYIWPFADLGWALNFKNFTLNTDVRFDLYYEFGPDGLDPTNRLYMRNEDSYIGFSSKYFKIHLGRFENNWGQYGKKSTFLTENSSTFDQLTYSIGTPKISFTSLNGFLDQINSNDVFQGNTIYDASSKRRYLSLKRIDWRVTDHLLIAFKEGILYSGLNVNLEPKYMVPSYIYFFLEGAAPRDQIENLMLGTSLWYNKNGLSLNIDFMLDDLIFNREEREITERNNFSLIFNSRYRLRERPISFNWDAELITYQAYNTSQAEGRYLYLGKGIATAFNDYFFSEVGIDYYVDNRVKGLIISPYGGVLMQGEQMINQTFESAYPNGEPYEIVLTGIVESTKRIGIKSFYSPVSYFWVELNIGMNFIENKNNIEGINEAAYTGMVELGFKYNF
ncbi:MAG: hypothetical protein JXR20_00695 [Balneola sp.]